MCVCAGGCGMLQEERAKSSVRWGELRDGRRAQPFRGGGPSITQHHWWNEANAQPAVRDDSGKHTGACTSTHRRRVERELNTADTLSAQCVPAVLLMLSAPSSGYRGYYNLNAARWLSINHHLAEFALFLSCSSFCLFFTVAKKSFPLTFHLTSCHYLFCHLTRHILWLCDLCWLLLHSSFLLSSVLSAPSPTQTLLR